MKKNHRLRLWMMVMLVGLVPAVVTMQALAEEGGKKTAENPHVKHKDLADIYAEREQHLQSTLQQRVEERKKLEAELKKNPPEPPKLYYTKVIETSKECELIAEGIREFTASLGNCWKDSDCTAVTLGCPWQIAPCDQVVISHTEPEKNAELAQKVTEYTTKCIVPDKAYAEACQKFNTTIKASNCYTQDVMCVAGKCMTQTDIIMDEEGLAEKMLEGNAVPEDIKLNRGEGRKE